MRYRRRYHRRSAFHGSKAAIQHVSARRELSQRIAGIDQDVLEILYRAPYRTFVDLLLAYERLHGKAAADYLEKAFPRWRDGQTKVSGQSAERLVNLVPKFLTRDQRYTLLKKLYDANKSRQWEHFHVDIVLGHTENVSDKINSVMQRLCSKPKLNELPEAIQRTVAWVCNEDSAAARSIMAAIETEESVLLASGGQVEIKRLIDLIGRMDRSAQGTHSIQFPYGSLMVMVRQPTFFEKLGRFFR